MRPKHGDKARCRFCGCKIVYNDPRAGRYVAGWRGWMHTASGDARCRYCTRCRKSRRAEWCGVCGKNSQLIYARPRVGANRKCGHP